MELRRISDTLLRSRASPLLYFLTPSVPTSWRRATSFQRQCQLLRAPRLNASPLFSTSATSQAASYSSADHDFQERPAIPSAAQSHSSLKSDSSDSSETISRLLDTFDPTTRRHTSASMMEAQHRNSKSTIRDRGARRQGDVASKMQMPSSSSISSTYAYQGMPSQNPLAQARRTKRTIKSRPSVGRTVDVDPIRGVDVGTALRSLNALCTKNNVFRDFSQQRFHERPGLKRKRLKSVRWRRFFREGFRTAVNRVKEMRRRGW